MRVLLDTGILLRVLHATDPRHAVIRAAVDRLELDGHSFACGIQNIAEFWNVTTRPSTTRGGFGQSLQVAEQRLAILERLVAILAESMASYAEWRRLVVQHRVSGVQVHDARLVAIMRVHGIDTLLTLNARDFVRYPWLTILTPEQVVQPGGPP